ncbi:MAG: hypothetical protein NVSMB16_05380 [Acidimicrobiales bacterium]
MQHLHLVGFTAELDGLIFSARRGSKAGGYVVSLDDRLLDSIREAIRLKAGGDLSLSPDDETAPGAPTSLVPDLRRSSPVHSALSPKEIQARLRAGRSVAEVAEEGGVDESWILRFASPVLAEQARVVERALQVHCHAARKGESALTLGQSVERNIVDRGAPLTADELSGGWSAFHLRDGAWVVRFRYPSRRRAQTAQWAFDLADLSLVPMNRLATELGFVDQASRRRRRSPEGLTANDEGVGGGDAMDSRTARSSRRVAPTRGGRVANSPMSRNVTRATTRSPARATKGVKATTGPARPAKAVATKGPARAAKAVKAPKGPARVTKVVKATRVAARSPKPAIAARATKTARATKATGPTKAVARPTKASKASKAPGATRVPRAPTASKTPRTSKSTPLPARATRVSRARAGAGPAPATTARSPRSVKVRSSARAEPGARAKKAVRPALVTSPVPVGAVEEVTTPAALVTAESIPFVHSTTPGEPAAGERMREGGASGEMPGLEPDPGAPPAPSDGIVPVLGGMHRNGSSHPLPPPDVVPVGSARRPPVSALTSQSLVDARRVRPLVAVRARPAPPLRSRVVRAPNAGTPARLEGAAPGDAQEPRDEPALGAVVIEADRAGPTTPER